MHAHVSILQPTMLSSNAVLVFRQDVALVPDVYLQWGHAAYIRQDRVVMLSAAHHGFAGAFAQRVQCCLNLTLCS